MEQNSTNRIEYEGGKSPKLRPIQDNHRFLQDGNHLKLEEDVCCNSIKEQQSATCIEYGGGKSPKLRPLQIVRKFDADYDEYLLETEIDTKDDHTSAIGFDVREHVVKKETPYINVFMYAIHEFDLSIDNLEGRLSPASDNTNDDEKCIGTDSVAYAVKKQWSKLWSGRYDSDASHRCNILLGGTNLVISTPIYDSNGGLDDTTIKQSSGYTDGHMQLGTIKQPSGHSDNHAQLGSRIRYNHGGKHNDDRIVITKRDVLAKQSWMEGTVWYMPTAGQSLMKSKMCYSLVKAGQSLMK